MEMDEGKEQQLILVSVCNFSCKSSDYMIKCSSLELSTTITGWTVQSAFVPRLFHVNYSHTRHLM